MFNDCMNASSSSSLCGSSVSDAGGSVWNTNTLNKRLVLQLGHWVEKPSTQKWMLCQVAKTFRSDTFSLPLKRILKKEVVKARTECYWLRAESSTKRTAVVRSVQEDARLRTNTLFFL
jgi:hypothetical protein